MDEMTEISKEKSIGYLLKKLNEEGITDFHKVAEQMQALKDAQNREGIWAYDRYTETGSASNSTVITEFGEQKKECILWCLNNYLGLNRNQKIIDKVTQAISKYGTGSGTSAVSGGMSSLHKAVQYKLQEILSKEKVLIFPTGFSANLGTLSAIPGPRDLLLIDHECHASIINGCQLSGKKFRPFRHNDLSDLESKVVLAKEKFENIIVVVESAYSMSGDLSPIKEIVDLKKKHGFSIFVDEAHTFGLYGKNGSGYCSAEGVLDEIDFFMATLSKAVPSIGGFIAAKEKYCTLLQARATSFLFQTCLSPVDASVSLACLEEIQADPSHMEKVHSNNSYFRKELKRIGFDLGKSQSPVVPIYVPNLDVLFAMSKELYYDYGIFSVPVSFPVVPISEGRLRFTMTAAHSIEQIDRTLTTLENLGKKYGIISEHN
jgi:glycine C-acetyltransferase